MFTKNIKRYTKENNLDNNLIPFLSSYYQRINVARLQHLESLNLDIANKKVIDLGAGIGDHSLFYLFKNCSVMAVEGRRELVNFISERFGIKSITIDFETQSKEMDKLGTFDIIHCYGLLYHLSNPLQFISHLGNLGTMLFIETCVSDDYSSDSINLISENELDATQAISGTGCRPRRDWIFSELKKYFPFVYLPTTQPKNNQFPQDWNGTMPNLLLKRAIFIASKVQISNPLLTTEIIKNYNSW